MTETEFARRLSEIATEAQQKTLMLLQQAHGMSDDQWYQTPAASKPALPFAREHEWRRAADSFAGITWWVYTMVRAEHSKRGSFATKLRKALGYTYP